jgi:hypothetical protein
VQSPASNRQPTESVKQSKHSLDTHLILATFYSMNSLSHNNEENMNLNDPRRARERNSKSRIWDARAEAGIE